MALLFSHVRASTPDGNEVEFLVSGIPREDENFLSGHCDNIESVDFTCNYSPDELFGIDWG